MTDRLKLRVMMEEQLQVRPGNSNEMDEYINQDLDSEIIESCKGFSIYDLTDRPAGLYPEENYDIYILKSDYSHTLGGCKLDTSLYTEDYLIVGFDEDDKLQFYYLNNRVYKEKKLTEFVRNIIHSFKQ